MCKKNVHKSPECRSYVESGNMAEFNRKVRLAYSTNNMKNTVQFYVFYSSYVFCIIVPVIDKDYITCLSAKHENFF